MNCKENGHNQELTRLGVISHQLTIIKTLSVTSSIYQNRRLVIGYWLIFICSTFKGFCTHLRKVSSKQVDYLQFQLSSRTRMRTHIHAYACMCACIRTWRWNQLGKPIPVPIAQQLHCKYDHHRIATNAQHLLLIAQNRRFVVLHWINYLEAITLTYCIYRSRGLERKMVTAVDLCQTHSM